MINVRWLFCGIFAIVLFRWTALAAEQSLELPRIGETSLRILTPQLLEVTRINTKPPGSAPVHNWDFVSGNDFNPPSASQFAVTIDGQPAGVQSVVGFKRRPYYAPGAKRDLRIQNALYLRLSRGVSDGQLVVVRNPGSALWPAGVELQCRAEPQRYSPAIHVNQEGYAPGFPKKAMVGYYLGSAGELSVPAGRGFTLARADSGEEVFAGALTRRRDNGYTYSPTPYQEVYEADFSQFTTPGSYKLVVPQLGASLPFRIGEGVPMAFARTYALGLYHQRCGTENRFPFTRFAHGECHVDPADTPLPRSSFPFTWNTVAFYNSDYAENPRHTAPQLKDPSSQRYPFVRNGRINVSGGHHDAGDYSKYTVNSAAFVHHLLFAVDAFRGVASLDNLGIPESGDGVGDLLQEAKWEADFLARMQDSDGGFYFLVYPRDREYEDNVLPDHGDPQVVWPKNTAATAAAVAALAQCASSPAFRARYPAEAAAFLSRAQLGWNFLSLAIARHGKNGAYQKVTHYGDDFMHNDEMAWAACELFLATGDPGYREVLFDWLPNPNDPDIRRYGWWRLYASYGCAIRSYAFAALSGRRGAGDLHTGFLAACQAEVLAAAEDHVRRAGNNAYATSFPLETKRHRTAGWYFSSERAFDIAAAWQLDPRAEYIEAIVGNVNYEAGCNPVNVCYIEGLGWHRQRERVHQYAANDRRVLPPSGFPIGNIQSGFPSFGTYGSDLSALSFPRDNAATAPYPFYDRWADTWNVSTEFVTVDLARSLGAVAFLAALTDLAAQPWSGRAARIAVPSEVPVNGIVTLSLVAPGIDLAPARVVWEIEDMEPAYAPASFPMLFSAARSHWIEAEACLPDGRRLFAATNLTATFNLRTLEDALDTGLPVASTGWFGQTALSHDGEDAARSPVLARGQSARMEMAVRGPGLITFWWRSVSSDARDKLRFFVDGVVKGTLAGTKGWRLASFSIDSAARTIAWEYARDAGSAVGAGTGWVDQVEILTLGGALDWNPLWSTAGAAQWRPQRKITYDGEDAAQSGTIGHGGATSMQSVFTGPGTIQFWWKVSSEPKHDTLRFYIGGAEQGRVSGEVDWHFREFHIPPGPQTLKWTYQKNSRATRGQDRAWVDQIAFVALAASRTEGKPLRITGAKGQAVLSWAADNETWKVFFKENLSDPAWRELPQPVTVRDGVASVTDSAPDSAQRFYRITRKDDNFVLP